jgi:hypothetical protein
MGDLEGVLDMLGGDRREVKAALEILTAGDQPTITFDGESGRRVLRIVQWASHNRIDESTERSQRHREKIKESVARNALQTVAQRVSNADATPIEERRVEKTPVVPTGDTGMTGASEAGEPAQLALEVQDPPKPDPVLEVFAAYLDARKATGAKGSPPKLDDKRRKLIARRLEDYPLEDVAGAARGLFRSAWHRENHATGIELAMRDSAHLERFRDQTDAEALAPAALEVEPGGAARMAATLQAMAEAVPS